MALLCDKRVSLRASYEVCVLYEAARVCQLSPAHMLREGGSGCERLLGRYHNHQVQLSSVLRVKALPCAGKLTAHMLRQGEDGLTGHLRDIITVDVNVHGIAWYIMIGHA